MRRGASRLAVLGLALSVGLLGACEGKAPRRKATVSAAGPAGSASGPARVSVDEDSLPDGPAVADVDLSAGAPEQRSGGLLDDEQGTFFDLVTALSRLDANPAYPGVMVRFGSGTVGWGRGADVVRQLKRLRDKGKVVYCHADSLGNATYGVAAEGCDQIWLSPAGGVETVGIGAELVFARDLLAKVGVEADILQVGRFKGTGETLTRSEASPELRASLQGALGGLRAHWLAGIEAGRPGGRAREAVEKGPYAPGEALAAGVIDAIGYPADALAALRRKVKGGKPESVFSSQTAGGVSGGLLDLARGLSGARRPGGKRAAGRVAVLRASGSITMSRSSGPLGGSGGIAARPVIRQLRELAEDGRVDAVVLRIDSPGGSALASDLLWYDLMRLREKKPLVVSIGDMAASGGYYMACAGQKIVAEEASIVGSIGVVGGKVPVQGALAKVGVKVEVVPADPGGDARRVAYESAVTPWDDASRERALGSMRAVYDLFLERVARGRGRPVSEVATFAEGRIFAGREALERGMIDEIGGLNEAVAVARREAGLGAEAEVVLVERGSALEELLGKGVGGGGDDARVTSLWQVTGAALPESWRPWAGQLEVHAASMAPLLGGERALVALPFALLVR